MARGSCLVQIAHGIAGILSFFGARRGRSLAMFDPGVQQRARENGQYRHCTLSEMKASGLGIQIIDLDSSRCDDVSEDLDA